MISQTAEYALRALICLANSPGAWLTTRQIAERGKIPTGYLAKLMQPLARAGIVAAQRGAGGGFQLKVAADQLTLLDVVAVSDVSLRVGTCPLGIHGTALCALHRRIDDVAAAVEDMLRETTLADLLIGGADGCGDVAAVATT
jgi:Rrf2 family transcriptional regulator, nitric oxide-sensitive transcriptional repressor